MGMYETMDDYKEKLAEKTGSPVLSVIGVSPRGATGAGSASYAVGKLSPLAGMAITKARGLTANKNAGGLGKIGVFSFKNGLLALTADKLYAFELKTGWGGLKVKDPIAVWDRKQIKVTGEGKKATSAIDIDVIPTGEHFEVEAVTSFGNDKYVQEFFDTLNAA